MVDVKHFIEKYLTEEYKGGLIKIEDLADYCKVSIPSLCLVLGEMLAENKVKVIKRYFCPEFHLITDEFLSHCEDCDYHYGSLDIEEIIYAEFNRNV